MNNSAETVSGIALALSGGGIRATVFHLGALLRLAKSGHLETVTQLSSVSGVGGAALRDGGVYKNLGVEALYKIGIGFVYPNTKFLLVCDAGQRLLEGSSNVRGPIYFDGVLPCLSLNVRSIDIMMEQNRALHSAVASSFL